MQTQLTHLHLGCGLKTPPGWLNVDGSWQVVIARHGWLKKVLVAIGLLPPQQAEIPWSSQVVRLDITRPLPFLDGTFIAIYSSHTLEHLYHDDALRLLKECFRVLRVGAVCRIVVPDVESLIADYRKAKEGNDVDAGTRLMKSLLFHDTARKQGPLGLFHRFTGFHQHKWMYDGASLRRLMEEAGFKEVHRAKCLESRIARLAEVEDPNRIIGGKGVAVEGVKL